MGGVNAEPNIVHDKHGNRTRLISSPRMDSAGTVTCFFGPDSDVVPVHNGLDLVLKRAKRENWHVPGKWVGFNLIAHCCLRSAAGDGDQYEPGQRRDP
jgi:hypothetical protein